MAIGAIAPATGSSPPPGNYNKSLFQTALSGARDAAFIISVFLIFAGVVFRHRYYAAFDMPPSMAEGSIYLVLLDAYNVLVDHAVAVLTAATVAIVLLLIASHLLRRSHMPLPLSRGVLTGISAVLIVAAFPALAGIAQDSADKQSNLVRGRYLIGARVHLKGAFGNSLPTNALLDASSVSVIGETDRDVFVLYQPAPSKAHPTVFPDGEVLDIPREAIDFVESNLVASSELSR